MTKLTSKFYLSTKINDYPMKNTYMIFLRSLMIYSLIISAVSYGICYFLPEEFVSSKLIYIILLFFSVTLVSHIILLKSRIGKPVKFVNVYLLLTLGRLLFFLTILLIYIFVNREDAIPFSISFLILYFFFSGFEMFQNMKIAKKKEDHMK